jgi:hypothetical protein
MTNKLIEKISTSFDVEPDVANDILRELSDLCSVFAAHWLRTDQ